MVTSAGSHYGINTLEDDTAFLSSNNPTDYCKKIKSNKKTDPEVVADAISGNRKAIKELIQYLTPVIQASVAHILTRSKTHCSNKSIRQEVADHCQEVFMMLFKNDSKVLRSWDPDKGMNLTSFISLISKRRVISELRKEHFTHHSDDIVFDENIEQFLKLPDEEEQFVNRHLLLRLVSILKNDISELGYDIFVQIFLYENTAEEVALRFGLSKNAIYVWKNRLRSQVKEIASNLELNKLHINKNQQVKKENRKRGWR